MLVYAQLGLGHGQEMTLVLSFYGCGAGRPCQLLRQSRASVVPTAVHVTPLGQTSMAVAGAPLLFLYATIYQHRCCASVAHRAPKPRLVQLRLRCPVCASCCPRRGPPHLHDFPLRAYQPEKPFSLNRDRLRHVTSLPAFHARAHSAST